MVNIEVHSISPIEHKAILNIKTTIKEWAAKQKSPFHVGYTVK
jgi:hypothetical protein